MVELPAASLHPSVNVNFEHRQPGWVARLVLACILLLLAATFAQAAHVCGLSIFGASSATQLRPASATSTLCLICLMAQSAVAAFVFAVLSPALHHSLVVRSPQVAPRSLLDSFRLYVRPPPVS
jgi:hypothetical protein